MSRRRSLGVLLAFRRLSGCSRVQHDAVLPGKVGASDAKQVAILAAKFASRPRQSIHPVSDAGLHGYTSALRSPSFCDSEPYRV